MELINLTRLSEKNKAGKRRQLGLFRCSCGTTKELSVSSIKSKSIKSCGCSKTIAAVLSRKDSKEVIINTAFIRTKNNAKIRNIEFELSRKEHKDIVEAPCYYCNSLGDEFKQSKGNRTESRNLELASVRINGVDRIDSNLDYTVDNCVSCCKKCNLAKHVMLPQEYIEHCMQVVLNHNNKNNDNRKVA